MALKSYYIIPGISSNTSAEDIRLPSVNRRKNFIPIKPEGKEPVILILTIRTSKFGGHYMPVILRERLTVTTVA
jgi:hypothetical protein